MNGLLLASENPSTGIEPDLEVSVVIPCLNEMETVAGCVAQAVAALKRHGVTGEVLVADNGSTDGSRELAAAAGARVVEIRDRGYGSALRGGFAAARGRYLVMGDADGSYDFGDLMPFLARLREGYDLVMGNRFLGGIRPGAMPWKNRWIGNPLLSGLGRLLFGIAVGDFHCGLRALTRTAAAKLGLRTTGMEFASEMVIKAHLFGLRIAEVPTTLSPDGRSRPPHLRPWRDGWRHLRFMLLFSPRWLFLAPGASLFLLGAALTALLVRGPVRLGHIGLDVHSLLVASFVCLLGYQLLIFGVFARVYAAAEGFHPPSARLVRVSRRVSLEGGVIGGLTALGTGIVLLVLALLSWGSTGFSELDPAVTMRQVVPSVLLMALGTQTVFASFFISILTLAKTTVTGSPMTP